MHSFSCIFLKLKCLVILRFLFSRIKCSLYLFVISLFILHFSAYSQLVLGILKLLNVTFLQIQSKHLDPSV